MQTNSPPVIGAVIAKSGKVDRSVISSPPAFYLTHENNAKSPTSKMDGGAMREIVFNDLIRFDQGAIPVMISQ